MFVERVLGQGTSMRKLKEHLRFVKQIGHFRKLYSSQTLAKGQSHAIKWSHLHPQQEAWSAASLPARVRLKTENIVYVTVDTASQNRWLGNRITLYTRVPHALRYGKNKLFWYPSFFPWFHSSLCSSQTSLPVKVYKNTCFKGVPTLWFWRISMPSGFRVSRGSGFAWEGGDIHSRLFRTNKFRVNNYAVMTVEYLYE